MCTQRRLPNIDISNTLSAKISPDPKPNPNLTTNLYVTLTFPDHNRTPLTSGFSYHNQIAPGKILRSDFRSDGLMLWAN